MELFGCSSNKERFYLLPSPELYMKRLVAEGAGDIFQICPAFRAGERGKAHLAQFTILEWYRTGADYRDLMGDCEELLCRVSQVVQGLNWSPPIDPELDLNPPFKSWTVSEAFRRFAGWDPGSNPEEDRFFSDLIHLVEPGLAGPRPVFLMDFPASMASLARLRGEVAERVELYCRGLELGNGFTELNDSAEQRRRFEAENRKRMLSGLEPLEIPEEFLRCLDDLPLCAGMAVGLERLVMLLGGYRDINEAVACPPW